MCGTIVVFPGIVAECRTEDREPEVAQKTVPTAAPSTSRDVKEGLSERSDLALA